MRNKKLFQGMGIGYVACLFSHVIATVLPMYIILPFARNLFQPAAAAEVAGHASRISCHLHQGGAGQGLLAHIATDLLTLTVVIIPITTTTWLVHRFVKTRIKKAPSPCDHCCHRS